MPKTTPKLQSDLNFLYEVGCLRFVERTWRQFLNPDFANLSEHTLRVIWIALIIAQHERVQDTGKLVKMALVHDLAESRGVDVHYVSRRFTDRHEDQALTETLENVSLAAEFSALNQEYEERKTKIAQIVKDADNLDVDLELKEQEVKGVTLNKKWHQGRERVKTKLYTKTAQKLWDLIQKSDPSDWHWQANNRFNAGDWKK